MIDERFIRYFYHWRDTKYPNRNLFYTLVKYLVQELDYTHAKATEMAKAIMPKVAGLKPKDRDGKMKYIANRESRLNNEKEKHQC